MSAAQTQSENFHIQELANPTQKALFFASPWLDSFCMGGFGILCWLLLSLSSNYSDILQNSPSTSALTYLLIFFWYPHIIGSWAPLYKPLKQIQKFPSTAIAFPILLIFGALIATRDPGNLLNHWAKFASLWLGFHLCNQTLNLMFLYAKRANLIIKAPIKAIWSTLIFSCLLYTVLRFECKIETSFDLSHQMDLASMQLPRWIEGIALIALALSALLTLGSVLFLKLKNESFPPFIIFLPAILHLLWWISGPNEYTTKFLWFGAFHGIQYLLISHTTFATPLRKRKVRLPKQVARAIFQRHSILLITGLILFKGLPSVASLLGTPPHLAAPAILSALIMHHCFTEGMIAKPRTQSDQNIIQPLNTSSHASKVGG